MVKSAFQPLNVLPNVLWVKVTRKNNNLYIFKYSGCISFKNKKQNWKMKIKQKKVTNYLRIVSIMLLTYLMMLESNLIFKINGEREIAITLSLDSLWAVLILKYKGKMMGEQIYLECMKIDMDSLIFNLNQFNQYIQSERVMSISWMPSSVHPFKYPVKLELYCLIKIYCCAIEVNSLFLFAAKSRSNSMVSKVHPHLILFCSMWYFITLYVINCML